VLRCAAKCAAKCAKRLHTWRAARPHQHWVFGGAPSPTTRPPRMKLGGWVRVVGLGALWVEWLVGAGGSGGALGGRAAEQKGSEKRREVR
jgi:hypothetical protein